jgi:hypothetical protein
MMTKRPRRNRGAMFTAKVALEALKEKQTLVESGTRFQVRPFQFCVTTDKGIGLLRNRSSLLENKAPG